MAEAQHIQDTVKKLSSGVPLLNGSGLRIGIVHARWSKPIVDRLVAGAMAQLLEHGVNEGDIILRDVPGCWELPFAVQRLIYTNRVDAVIAIGVLIKGETMHFEYISAAVTQGLMQVQLQGPLGEAPEAPKSRGSGTPVVLGVLTVMTSLAVDESRRLGQYETWIDHHGPQRTRLVIRLPILEPDLEKGDSTQCFPLMMMIVSTTQHQLWALA